MAATKNPASSGRAAASPYAVEQITYLAATLKAPWITEVATRLADQARDAGWTHEDYLAAVLEREVSARNASGVRLGPAPPGSAPLRRWRNFDVDAQPAIRPQVAALASGGFLTEGRNVVLLGPPGTGKTHLATALGVAAPTDTASCSRPRPNGSPDSPTPIGPAGCPKSSPGCGAMA